MADFAQFRDTSRPEASAVRPTEAVADTSAATLLQGVGKTISAVSSAAQLGAQSNTEKSSRSYLKAQTDIVNQFGSGQITEAEKAAKLRLNYQRALDAGTIPVDDLRKYTKDFINLGSNDENMSLEAKRWKETIDTGVQAGFVDINADYRTQQTQAADYAKMQAQVTKSQAVMTNINATDAQRAQAQKDIIREAYPVYTDKFLRNAQAVVADFKSGAITQEDAVMQLNQYKAEVAGFATQLGPDAVDYGNTLVAPINSQLDNALMVVNGDMEVDVMKKQLDRIKTAASLDVWSDPAVATIGSLQTVLPYTDILTKTNQGEAIKRHLDNIISTNSKRVIDVTNMDDKRAIEGSFTAVKEAYKSFEAGEAGEETAQAVRTSVNRTIESIAKHGIHAESPSEFNTAVDFLASDEIGRVLTQNGGVDAEYAADAALVLQEAYIDPAVQSVLKDFQEGNTNTYPALRSLGGDATTPTRGHRASY